VLCDPRSVSALAHLKKRKRRALDTGEYEQSASEREQSAGEQEQSDSEQTLDAAKQERALIGSVYQVLSHRSRDLEEVTTYILQKALQQQKQVAVPT
jgi:hypothetical protein